MWNDPPKGVSLGIPSDFSYSSTMNIQYILNTGFFQDCLLEQNSKHDLAYISAIFGVTGRGKDYSRYVNKLKKKLGVTHSTIFQHDA